MEYHHDPQDVRIPDYRVAEAVGAELKRGGVFDRC